MAGAKTLNDWTEQSVSLNVTLEGITTLSLAVSKYVCGADYYLDNVKLIDANGNDVLNGTGNFCQEKAVEYAPITIAASNPGTNYVWYNHNGFVNNDTKTMEIVADGADDVGAVHVYQPDGQTADADMMMGIRIEGAPVGTYTIQYKI